MDLNQITIHTTHVQKALEFYLKLGLILIVDALPRYVRMMCPDGNSTVSINRIERRQESNAITLYFEDPKLDEIVKDLKAKGLSILSDPEDKDYLWREASLLDPDGNKIIIFSAGKNRKNPPWRI